MSTPDVVLLKVICLQNRSFFRIFDVITKPLICAIFRRSIKNLAQVMIFLMAVLAQFPDRETGKEMLSTRPQIPRIGPRLFLLSSE